MKLAFLKTSHVVAVGPTIATVQSLFRGGEVRRFGGRGVGEMMSRVNVALGQKQTRRTIGGMAALPRKADIDRRSFAAVPA